METNQIHNPDITNDNNDIISNNSNDSSSKNRVNDNNIKTNNRILKQPEFICVNQITPESRGINLVAKILSIDSITESQRGLGPTIIRTAEALVGDNTGVLILIIKNEQIDLCKQNSTIIIRNGFVRMMRGHIRVEVDKWGKIVNAADDAKIVPDEKNNISSCQYTLVRVDGNDNQFQGRGKEGYSRFRGRRGPRRPRIEYSGK